MKAAQKMLGEGAFILNGTSVPVACLGPAVVHVTAFRVPLFVIDAALAAALGTYGKVLNISHPFLKGRRHVANGTRLARMEMKQAMPNFLTVVSHRVMFDYRGMRTVCSRCGQDGHRARRVERRGAPFARCSATTHPDVERRAGASAGATP